MHNNILKPYSKLHNNTKYKRMLKFLSININKIPGDILEISHIIGDIINYLKSE